jgi:hypothetical protein
MFRLKSRIYFTFAMRVGFPAYLVFLDLIDPTIFPEEQKTRSSGKN